MANAPVDFGLHCHTLTTAIRQQGVRETARRAGVTPMVVSRFINGQSNVNAIDLYAIAAALDYDFHLCATPTANTRLFHRPSRETRRPKRP